VGSFFTLGEEERNKCTAGTDPKGLGASDSSRVGGAKLRYRPKKETFYVLGVGRPSASKNQERGGGTRHGRRGRRGGKNRSEWGQEILLLPEGNDALLEEKDKSKMQTVIVSIILGCTKLEAPYQ